MRNAAKFLLSAPFICCLLLAQPKGGGPTSGSPTGVGTAPSPTGPSTTRPSLGTTSPGNLPTITRPLYVSGRVVMDDGSPVSKDVTIIRVCNGVTRSMGYTDSKGTFGFDLNHAEAAFQDARTTGIRTSNGDPTSTAASLDDPLSDLPRNAGLSSQDSERTALIGCELRAQLSGYRSSAVQLGRRDVLDNPDVGVIFLHRIGPDEGSTVSMTSLKAPKDAKKAYEKGMNALKKKKTEDAEKNFQKAVTVYPEYADAWFQLGALQMDAKDNDAARKSFGQAIAADPKLVTPYVNLAILEAQQGNWKESADNTSKAVHLDPVDFPIAFYFDALANYNLKNYAQSEKSARQLERLDTQHHFPLANRILASVLAQRKDYPGAADQMREYLKVAGTAQDANEVRGQLEQLEKLISQQAPAKAQ